MNFFGNLTIYKSVDAWCDYTGLFCQSGESRRFAFSSIDVTQLILIKWKRVNNCHLIQRVSPHKTHRKGTNNNKTRLWILVPTVQYYAIRC